MTMEVYIPIYMRSPNKFLRYEERYFDDGAGHYGTKRFAIFTDKKGNLQEMVAQVLWDDGGFDQ